MPGSYSRHWTIREAAKVTGQSGRLIRRLIVSRRLSAVIHGGEALVEPVALQTSLVELAMNLPDPLERTGQDRIEAQRRRNYVLAGLPTDKRSRVEELHQRLEAGQRLTRRERAELDRLDHGLIAQAGQRLEEWTRQSASASA